MRRVLNRSKPLSSCCLIGVLALAAIPAACGQDSLIADSLPAAEKGGLLLSSCDAAVDSPLESVFCPPRSCARWTASADFVMLDRIGSVPYALVQTVPRDRPYTDPGVEALNANDLHQGLAAGPKLGLVRHGGSGYDLELLYFQIDGWNDSRSIGPSPDYWLVMTAPGDFIQTQDHKETQMMAWSYSSRLYNAEWNVRWHPNDRLTLLAGFRWANLSEGLRGTLPELPGTWPNRRNPFWNASVRNNLYGFQIGADGKLLERGRFSLNGLIKAGIFGNDAAETTGVSIDRTVYWESASTGHAAFLGETGLQCKYQVSQRLLFKLGYEALWLQGVALAPGQIADTYSFHDSAQTYVQALGVNCGAGVFYHGVTAGLECSF